METEKIRKQFIIVKSLVLNNKNEILFVKRKMEQFKQAHGKWEFPGGKVDFGENPEETAVREVKEETGFTVEVSSLLPKILSSKWILPDREAQQILICYICKYISGEISLEDHGVSEVKWISTDNLPKDSECLPGTIDFVNEYLKRKV